MLNRYVVIYTRNDTGAVARQQTTDRGLSIENLFPGAGYRVQVRFHIIYNNSISVIIILYPVS